MKTFQFQQFSLSCPDESIHPMGTDSWLLGASVEIPLECKNILDIGTGTGVVALMLAQRTEQNGLKPDIHALDIHQPSVNLSQQNFQATPWSSRLKAIVGDINSFEMDIRYQLIVCNPPFFTENTTSNLAARHRVRHESNLPIQCLVNAVKRLLDNDGRFFLIAPFAYCRQFEEVATIAKLYCNKTIEVYSTTQSDNPTRLLQEYSSNPYKFTRSSLSIWANQNEYSIQVKELLRQFFL